MAITKFFFDTYAIFEFIRGNKRYKRYFEECEIITSRLNMAELFYHLLNESGLDVAKFFFHKFRQFSIDFSDEIIIKAMIFRSKNKEMSYIDCITYTLAQENGLKFLTGDNHFKNFENVEFVG